MTTKEVVRETILNSDRIKKTLPKVLSVLSERPFNMKGQESEELFAYLIKNELEKNFGIGNVNVIVPGNKKLSDILIDIPILNEGFELKFYGKTDRAQLSTLKNILQDIREKFKNSKEGLLNIEDKKWLISKIKEEHFDYNLSFFVKKNKLNNYDISIFDFDSLDVESFIDNQFELKRVGKENRVEIFIKLSDSVSIEISSGRNALNRGIWLKGIKTNEDLKVVESTNYVKLLLETKLNLNFDSQLFIMEKSKLILDLIESKF